MEPIMPASPQDAAEPTFEREPRGRGLTALALWTAIGLIAPLSPTVESLHGYLLSLPATLALAFICAIHLTRLSRAAKWCWYVAAGVVAATWVAIALLRALLDPWLRYL
ncbi:MAG: hypothetical protein QM767_13410 [Anaeromyxobacter sp.]